MNTRTRFFYVASTLIVCYFSGSARAADQTSMSGSQLYLYCSSSNPESSTGCSAYILGMVDGMSMESAIAANGEKYCAPRIQEVQAEAMVMKAMKEHPEMMNQPAGAIVAAVLSAGFPCPQ
jgi:hypothetical protein